jgi:hypothetical protein
MPTYVCVKDNVITQLAKGEDPALVVAPGETQYVAPPVLPGAPEPEVGWMWNDGNPAPAEATTPPGEEKPSHDPGRAPHAPEEQKPDDTPAPPPRGTPPHRGSRRE